MPFPASTVPVFSGKSFFISLDCTPKKISYVTSVCSIKRKGKERKGQERKGKERKGKERKGKSR